MFAAALLLSLVPVQCPGDDTREDNDSCATAALLAAGTTSNLAVLSGDDDYFRIAVPAASEVTVTCRFTHAAGDIDLILSDATCSTTLDASQSITDDEEVSTTHYGAAPTDLVVRVTGYGLAFVCNDYELDISITPSTNPCAGLADDGLEENDVCAAATDLGTPDAGSWPNLHLVKGDADWYRLTVPAGFSLNAGLNFVHAYGDLDLKLFDACGGSLLALSVTQNNNEELSWSNGTGSTASVYLEAFVFSFSASDCNDYGLTVLVTNDAIGVNYCIAAINSTGFPAPMSASGSSRISQNDLVLVAGPVAPTQLGLFYYGPTQILFPFGDGFRCVGAGALGTFRLYPPVVADGAGELSRPVDNSSPPAAAGTLSAGSTWNFQAWYRDPDAGGAGFSLSDGFSIYFLP
ncbi:MAG: hypothetical protein CMK00_08840 [Planctomycetes bacterium]|nr:hypothetical protein [Planctomycetota bacterium]